MAWDYKKKKKHAGKTTLNFIVASLAFVLGSMVVTYFFHFYTVFHSTICQGRECEVMVLNLLFILGAAGSK